jgi:hypothetical protein
VITGASSSTGSACSARRNAARSCASCVDASARRLAVEPSVDAPRERVILARLAAHDRLGRGDRQVRREPRQDPQLLLDLARRRLVLRQAHLKLVAETEDEVIGPTVVERDDRQLAPLRELHAQQRVHEPFGNEHFVRMHSHHRMFASAPVQAKPKA